jgi:hypothetical protein
MAKDKYGIGDMKAVGNAVCFSMNGCLSCSSTSTKPCQKFSDDLCTAFTCKKCCKRCQKEGLGCEKPVW